MRLLRIQNASRGIVLGHSISVADTSSLRRKGLLKRTGLNPGEGLWIVPCEAIHTWGMKFAIDVVFLNRALMVVRTREEMAKRRMAICWRAHSVLELPAGTVARTGTRKGDQLEFARL